MYGKGYHRTVCIDTKKSVHSTLCTMSHTAEQSFRDFEGPPPMMPPNPGARCLGYICPLLHWELERSQVEYTVAQSQDCFSAAHQYCCPLIRRLMSSKGLLSLERSAAGSGTDIANTTARQVWIVWTHRWVFESLSLSQAILQDVATLLLMCRNRCPMQPHSSTVTQKNSRLASIRGMYRHLRLSHALFNQGICRNW